MEGQIIFEIFKSIIYLTGAVCIIAMLITVLRKIKEYSNSQRDIGTKLTIMHEILKDALANLRIIESKIGDLTVRINIAEVRLEERKPQQFMLPPQIPSISHTEMSVQPRRPGRPKSNPK